MNRFDWPTIMRAGIQGLRLTPDQFWRLTPAELRLMLGQGGAQAPMNRAGLAALQAAYPDKDEGEDDG
jgi:uncharacterized phage protein (TIGR02216 family)